MAVLQVWRRAGLPQQGGRGLPGGEDQPLWPHLLPVCVWTMYTRQVEVRPWQGLQVRLFPPPPQTPTVKFSEQLCQRTLCKRTFCNLDVFDWTVCNYMFCKLTFCKHTFCIRTLCNRTFCGCTYILVCTSVIRHVFPFLLEQILIICCSSFICKLLCFKKTVRNVNF